MTSLGANAARSLVTAMISFSPSFIGKCVS